MTNQVLVRRDGKLFCKKRVVVKAGIPPAINKKTQEICQNNCHVVIIKYNRKIEKITITFQ